jgi:alpha-tubulin suppressor-like RCC1 family protein
MIAYVRAVVLVMVAASCKYGEPFAGPGDAAVIDMPRVDGTDGSGCTALQVGTGTVHTCARLSDSTMWCWGGNQQGQLGVATQTMCGPGMACSPTPQQVPVSAVNDLALGDRHTCTTTASGVYCWGANVQGEFGDGTNTSSPAPIAVALRAGTTALATGQLYTCSLIGTGVQCSGQNQFGEVGDGTGTVQLSPKAAILPVVTVVKLGAGYDHMMAITDNGDLYGWGLNTSVQLDSGQPGSVFTPVQLAATNVTQVAGGVSHTCALISDHHVTCRGSNARGQIGQTGMGPFAFSDVTSITTPVDAIAAGGDLTCVITQGAVKCFGDHYSGTPMPITLPRPATALAVGNAHACAILDDGSVWCWGDNTHGQLGDGTTMTSRTVAKHALCR